jgi:hypothetical protein
MTSSEVTSSNSPENQVILTTLLTGLSKDNRNCNYNSRKTQKTP